MTGQSHRPSIRDRFKDLDRDARLATAIYVIHCTIDERRIEVDAEIELCCNSLIKCYLDNDHVPEETRAELERLTSTQSVAKAIAEGDHRDTVQLRTYVNWTLKSLDDSNSPVGFPLIVTGGYKRAEEFSGDLICSFIDELEKYGLENPESTPRAILRNLIRGKP